MSIYLVIVRTIRLTDFGIRLNELVCVCVCRHAECLSSSLEDLLFTFDVIKVQTLTIPNHTASHVATQCTTQSEDRSHVSSKTQNDNIMILFRSKTLE